MVKHVRVAIAVAALAAAAPAVAQGSKARLSAFGGEPLPQGASIFHGQFGWPGLWLTFLHGASSRLSLGGRFSFDYGFESQLGNIDLGVKFQALVRLGLVDTGKVSIGLDLAPGLLLHFGQAGLVTFGLPIPVAVVMGIPVNDAFSLHVAMEVPMLATLTGQVGVYVPLLFGGGLEYALDRNLQITLALRMGPFIDAPRGRANFGLNALFGIAFRI